MLACAAHHWVLAQPSVDIWRCELRQGLAFNVQSATSGTKSMVGAAAASEEVAGRQLRKERTLPLHRYARVAIRAAARCGDRPRQAPKTLKLLRRRRLGIIFYYSWPAIGSRPVSRPKATTSRRGHWLIARPGPTTTTSEALALTSAVGCPVMRHGAASSVTGGVFRPPWRVTANIEPRSRTQYPLERR